MNYRINNSLKAFAGIVLVGFVTVLLFTAIPQALAQQKGEAQGIVDKALVTLNGFMNDKNYTWLHNNLNRASGVLIFPQVLKAGFILGGSGGTGVLLAKDKNGTWSQPAFYTMGTVNFGLLAGAQAAEVILMVMKDSTLDSLYATSVKLGTGQATIAVGPHGAEAAGNITASLISFAKAKGLYAGLNLQGSVVGVRGKMNKAYYGKEVSPIQIIVENKVQDEGTTNLRSGLKKAAK